MKVQELINKIEKSGKSNGLINLYYYDRLTSVEMHTFSKTFLPSGLFTGSAKEMYVDVDGYEVFFCNNGSVTVYCWNKDNRPRGIHVDTTDVKLQWSFTS